MYGSGQPYICTGMAVSNIFLSNTGPCFSLCNTNGVMVSLHYACCMCSMKPSFVQNGIFGEPPQHHPDTIISLSSWCD